MRAIHELSVVLLTVALGGCGETQVEHTRHPHPVVVEARKHFTYRGKPIPPFFLADYSGGPYAPDAWFSEMGSRIASVVVEGLFIKSDGAYSRCEIEDATRDDGLVLFSFPVDQTASPYSAGWMGYRFIGTTPSGTTVIEYSHRTEGSAKFVGVLFVRFEMQSVGVTRQQRQDRLIMRCLGELCWGDRVYRDVKLEGNSLWLGPTRTDIAGYKDTLEPERIILLE